MTVRSGPYPRDRADQRSRLLDRAMSAAGPVSEGKRLVSVAVGRRRRPGRVLHET